jgi:hypothetical protein
MSNALARLQVSRIEDSNGGELRELRRIERIEIGGLSLVE